MRTHDRHERILQRLKTDGSLSVADLAEDLEVSPVTIRRDLMRLEDRGALTRTHGGAVLSRTSIVEFAIAAGGRVNAAEKSAIAREVAQWVRPGMSIVLDSGSTTLEVARLLSGVSPLRVLTSSLAIAAALYADEDIDLVLLGGSVRRGSPDLVGWLTEDNLRQFQVDLAVVGADGLTARGVFTNHVDQKRVCQAVMAAAATRLLVVDHSKIGRSAFARFASPGDFDAVVTDSGVPPAERKWLKRVTRKTLYSKV